MCFANSLSALYKNCIDIGIRTSALLIKHLRLRDLSNLFKARLTVIGRPGIQGQIFSPIHHAATVKRGSTHSKNILEIDHRSYSSLDGVLTHSRTLEIMLILFF